MFTSRQTTAGSVGDGSTVVVDVGSMDVVVVGVNVDVVVASIVLVEVDAEVVD